MAEEKTNNCKVASAPRQGESKRKRTPFFLFQGGHPAIIRGFEKFSVKVRKHGNPVRGKKTRKRNGLLPKEGLFLNGWKQLGGQRTLTHE